MKRLKLFILVMVIFVTACSTQSQNNENTAGNISHSAFPEAIMVSKETEKIYLSAAKYENVLQYMPCYCGCEDVGHTSNLSCFVKEMDDNGQVREWDLMGAG